MSLSARPLLLVGALLACLLSANVFAEVVSETLIFLNENGRDHLVQRTMRTEGSQYDFFVKKKIDRDALSYVHPNQYDWHADDTQLNRLHFNDGSFVVMYPDRFEEEIEVDENGVFTFNSWNGITREDGHFGSWNTPTNFSHYAYAWIVPQNIEIIDYQANREGEWVSRANSLSFFASDTNDLTFTIRYRNRDGDADGVSNRLDRCPQTPKGAAVDEHGCVSDSDGDGVANTDDRCPLTVAGTAVDSLGCDLDSDSDGIADHMDRCPQTPAGALIDRQGCELDFDADGVVNSRDECAHTPYPREVDQRGCEPDQDGDGVADALDKCPDSALKAEVDCQGCELDGDKDGVVDSKDQCPETPAGAAVDAIGCELDSDNDGVVDSKDQCPETPAGAAVDAIGCELDSDNDGVVDSKDQCPETPAGAAVDAIGCELDSDNDGVLNKTDLCPETKPGTEVDATGCDRTAAIVLDGVNFHTGSADLTEEAKGILDGVAASLSGLNSLKLEVGGHTDSSGAAELNRQLSQARAESVRDYLIDKGVAADILSAVGYGPDKPVADNTSAEGRSLNRRVELNRLEN